MPARGAVAAAHSVPLSERERRLLQMLTCEMSLAEMAQQLGVAEASLGEELKQLHRKLRVFRSR